MFIIYAITPPMSFTILRDDYADADRLKTYRHAFTIYATIIFTPYYALRYLRAT